MKELEKKTEYCKLKTLNFSWIIEKNNYSFNQIIIKKLKIIKNDSLFLAGINININMDQLKKFLTQFGKILKMKKCKSKVIKNLNKNKKSYSVFVNYSSSKSTILSIYYLNDLIFFNNKLKASFATIKLCKFKFFEKNCTKKNCSFYHGKIRNYNSILKMSIYNKHMILKILKYSAIFLKILLYNSITIKLNVPKFINIIQEKKYLNN